MPELTPDILVAYGSTLVSACIPIWIGSHLSLNQKLTETMTTKDAYMFPVIGSGVLFGLYLAFKILSKDYVNLLLTGYFLLFGVGAITATISPIIAKFIPEKANSKHDLSFTPFWSSEKLDLTFNNATVLATILSVGFSAWYAFTKHWIANNIFGACFCFQGIALVSPGNYKIACLLLIGLFFYDIFWVFGTDVMVTVAKSFDAPIKLLFPKNVFTYTDKFEFSMLGLGDIVIPGILIALLLRFDRSKGNSSVYFYVTFVAYFLGLFTTIAVMHIFNHAQPALLYLVPFCVLASFLTAVVKGEIGLLFNYSEEIVPEEKEEEKKEKDSKETKKSQ